MGFFSNLFKKNTEDAKVGGMEDYMTLLRVYFQASLAANLGINNLAALPDLRTFKSTLKVPTVNNKLGVGERNHCKKMMKDIYGTQDDFFKEIDNCLKKKLQKTAGCTAFHVSLPGLQSRPHDAHGKPHEVQTQNALLLQKSPLYHDGEDGGRCLQ